MAQNKNDSNKLLLKYAGLGFQFLVGIGMAVFVGIKGDEWLNMRFPLLVWLIPLLIIIGVIIKVVVDTGRK